MGMSRGWVPTPPLDMEPEGVGTHPWTLNLGYHELQLASGWYASYWNAFLYSSSLHVNKP